MVNDRKKAGSSDSRDVTFYIISERTRPSAHPADRSALYRWIEFGKISVKSACRVTSLNVIWTYLVVSSAMG